MKSGSIAIAVLVLSSFFLISSQSPAYVGMDGGGETKAEKNQRIQTQIHMNEPLKKIEDELETLRKANRALALKVMALTRLSNIDEKTLHQESQTILQELKAAANKAAEVTP